MDTPALRVSMGAKGWGVRRSWAGHMTRNPDTALRPALEAREAALDTLSALETALHALETRVEWSVKAALKAPSNAAQHRRAHKLGCPAKLAPDPELRAFVEARFDTLTFDQIAVAVADTFPPERRIARSSIHRWWKKHHKPATRIHP